MKNIQSIISNLSIKSNFKRLNTLNIINKLILTLPHNLRKSTLFSVIKNDSLLLAMNHPSSVSEFNNFRVRDMLLALDMLREQNSINIDEIRHIKQIRAYIPRDILKHYKRKLDDEIIIETYEERSSGEFYVDSANIFKEQFEAIKRAIRNNNGFNKKD